MARRSDNTRKELKEMAVSAGAELLESEGVEGMSARAIATRMGYTVGTLYNVFEDLEDIIMYINAETLKEMHAALEPLAKSKKKPLPVLHDFARCYCEYAVAHTARWSLLHSHPRSKPLPDWFHEEVHKIFALVGEPLMALSHSPSAARDAAKVLWAGLHGICSLSLSQKLDRVDGAPMQKLVKNFVEHYVKGLQ